ncbi:hypothetical protein [Nocardia sp. CDC160]|uniref:hypothetical protein n=1 Tax=Nocardia sp. CDC160 TaxID=3112166 RepID=UPI002DBDA5D5|nr:hypothetical protein [Nocardia sp. CDC160]MEC3916476.1 hypothetical protein [Nocardia sp. CDC160]
MTEVMPATGKETAPVVTRPPGFIAAQRFPTNPTPGPTRAAEFARLCRGDAAIATALYERYAR